MKVVLADGPADTIRALGEMCIQELVKKVGMTNVNGGSGGTADAKTSSVVLGITFGTFGDNGFQFHPVSHARPLVVDINVVVLLRVLQTSE